jgi:hypothetical protein
LAGLAFEAIIALLASDPLQALIVAIAIFSSLNVAVAAIIHAWSSTFVAIGANVREAALLSPLRPLAIGATALEALCLTLSPIVLDRHAAFLTTTLYALTVASTTLGTHGLALTSAHALHLAISPATLRLGLTAAATALRLGFSATTATALRLSLTISAAALVGLGGCRCRNCQSCDAGDENELSHLDLLSFPGDNDTEAAPFHPWVDMEEWYSPTPEPMISTTCSLG